MTAQELYRSRVKERHFFDKQTFTDGRVGNVMCGYSSLMVRESFFWQKGTKWLDYFLLFISKDNIFLSIGFIFRTNLVGLVEAL